MNSSKKKILFVRTEMGQGGADRVTLVVLKNLDRTKYEIALLLMKHHGEYLTQLPQDVKVIDGSSSSLWFFYFAIKRSINREKPDVIFSIDGGANVPLSIVAFLHPFRSWKVILSERNILFPPGKNKLKRSVLVLAKILFYRFADVLTAVSEGVRDDMKRLLWISSDRIKIVYNPMIEPELLAHANEPVEHPWFSRNREIPVIVHAGRFVYQKDHRTLVQAFARLIKQIPCRLFLLGDGPLMPSTKELAKALGIEENVHFAGFDLNPFRYFSKADLFVLSSRHEGMPGVLIQAMACGAPVISTDCPSGPSEIINQPGVNGLLVPVSNTDALVEAMVKVLTNKALADRFSKEGPAAVERFRVENAMSSYLKAIES